MLGIIFTILGIWAIYWGVYTLFVGKNEKRKWAAFIMSPIGLFCFVSGVLSFLMPGFFL
jgi:uncharacterized membrane protein HdeD (DUF308 family)